MALSSTCRVDKMVGRDDNLFQNFRLPWVPAWVPDWAEAGLRAGAGWKILLVGGLVCLGLYWGWGFGVTRGGSASEVAGWRSQIEQASGAQLPLVLDALFQVPDERVLALGLELLADDDHMVRQTAGLVLEDSAEKWERWAPLEAGRQWQRLLGLMAQSVEQWHPPQQALAVEMAERGLARPFPADPAVSTAILAHARQIVARSNPAHSGGFRWESAQVLPERPQSPQTERLSDFAPEVSVPAPNLSVPGSNLSVPGVAGDRVAGARANLSVPGRMTVPGRGVGPTEGGNLAPGNARTEGLTPPWQMAGFTTPGNRPSDSAGSGQTGAWETNGQGTALPSEVPLFDHAGHLIETVSVDPAGQSVPGGLIPVDLSRGFRTRLPAALPSRGVEPAEAPADAGDRSDGGRWANGDRQGSSRVAVGGSPAPDGQLAETGRASGSERVELTEAWRRREREVLASGPSGAPQAGAAPQSLAAAPSAGAVPTAVTTAVTPRPDGRVRSPESGVAAGGVRAMEVATSGNSRLPANPYRGNRAGSEDKKISNRVSRSTVAPGPLVGLSHIDVIKRLGAADMDEAQEAVQELRRRGFDANYLAVARRLISPDAGERYQLILDLVGSNRVEPTPFLRWLTGDEDPAVRALAIEALEMLNAAGRSRAVDIVPGGRRAR